MTAGAPGVPDRSCPARAAQPILGSTTAEPEDEPSASASTPATAVRGAAWPLPAITRTARTANTTGSARTLTVRMARPGVRARTRARMPVLSISSVYTTPATPRHEHEKLNMAARRCQYRTGYPETTPDP